MQLISIQLRSLRRSFFVFVALVSIYLSEFDVTFSILPSRVVGEPRPLSPTQTRARPYSTATREIFTRRGFVLWKSPFWLFCSRLTMFIVFRAQGLLGRNTEKIKIKPETAGKRSQKWKPAHRVWLFLNGCTQKRSPWAAVWGDWIITQKAELNRTSRANWGNLDGGDKVKPTLS